MKIADSDSIKAGEQELISSIMKRLNPETLAQVATKQLSPDMMEFIHGDMVIQDGQIVYKMDFRATLDISVTFDRDGDLVLSGETVAEADDVLSDEEEPLESEILDDADIDNMIESASSELEAEAVQPQDEADHDSLEDDMSAVFSRNRDFWNRKREEAVPDLDAGAEHPESMDES